MSFDLVLFGGTGDLAWRKLMPALFQAFRHGTLPEGGRIIGVGRDDLGHDKYRELIRARFDHVDLAKRPSAEEFARFAALLEFVQMDLSKPDDYSKLASSLNERNAHTVVMYVATAPALFTTVCEQLAAAGLNTPKTRVVLEKPLGHDLASNRAINHTVRKFFDEKQVFRIDHYLGKPAVQNLIALRFGTVNILPISRSALPKTWAWKVAAPSMKAPAPCATWCKTMRCNCSAPLRWSRPSMRMPTPSATRSSRCCARSNPGAKSRSRMM